MKAVFGENTSQSLTSAMSNLKLIRTANLSGLLAEALDVVGSYVETVTGSTEA